MGDGFGGPSATAPAAVVRLPSSLPMPGEGGFSLPPVFAEAVPFCLHMAPVPMDGAGV